jgi:hypothetical protein
MEHNYRRLCNGDKSFIDKDFLLKNTQYHDEIGPQCKGDNSKQ